MAIDITPLEVLVLKKLVLINHALATKIAGSASREQLALTKTLNEITLRADLDNKSPPVTRHENAGSK